MAVCCPRLLTCTMSPQKQPSVVLAFTPLPQNGLRSVATIRAWPVIAWHRIEPMHPRVVAPQIMAGPPCQRLSCYKR